MPLKNRGPPNQKVFFSIMLELGNQNFTIYPYLKQITP